MFSIFPDLLFLRDAGIGLIRIVAGLYLIYIGYTIWNERAVIAKERFPVIGRMPEWLSAIAAALNIVIGLALVVGAGVQLAALLGAIVALKCVVFAKKYPNVMPLPRSTSVLLFVVLLALVVTGAGALAFDLPL